MQGTWRNPDPERSDDLKEAHENTALVSWVRRMARRRGPSGPYRQLKRGLRDEIIRSCTFQNAGTPRISGRKIWCRRAAKRLACSPGMDMRRVDIQQIQRLARNALNALSSYQLGSTTRSFGWRRPGGITPVVAAPCMLPPCHREARRM